MGKSRALPPPPTPSLNFYVTSPSATSPHHLPHPVACFRSGASDLGGDMGSTSGPSTYTELLTVAATEVCVHLARTASQGRRPHRNMHAMARRVARTMVSRSGKVFFKGGWEVLGLGSEERLECERGIDSHMHVMNCRVC